MAKRPQWSPPLMGGVTDVAPAEARALVTPQWSPPLMGGVTRVLPQTSQPLVRPQWSPPLMGGVTPGGLRGKHLRDRGRNGARR